MAVGAHARRSIGEHQMREPVGRVSGQPLADHAAQRDAAKRELADLQRVGDGEHVAAQAAPSCIRLRDGGAAVAARVVTQNAEIRQKIGDLKIPHAVIGAERVGEDEHGRSSLPSRR